MQNARREASIRPLSLVLQLASLVQQLLILATYAALLARLSWWSTLVIVAASLPAFVAEARFSGESFRLNSWRAPEGRRQNYLEWIITRDSHVKEVKLFGLAPLILSRYRAYFEKFYSEDRKLALRKTWAGLVLGALSLLAFYASYLYMADRAARARITLGDLTLYLAAFRQGQQAIQSALASIGGLYEDGLFVSNLFAFLDLESTGERPRGKPRALPAARSQTVEFEDVSFQYPGGDRPALTGVTLRIEPGEKLALVGDNGAGKSTLIKLLLRLYEPSGGRILYGGIDLRDIDPRSLRDRIGILFQDFVRYQFTAQENVGLGQVQAIGERPRI
jgi:ATP-binding cassette, subfamily B, bacterial